MTRSATLTSQQVAALDAVVRSARALCPRDPPELQRADYASDALYTRAVDEAAQRWYASFRTSNLLLDTLGADLARATKIGALDVLRKARE